MNTSENFRSIEMIHAAQARVGHTGETPFDTNIPPTMKGVAYSAFISDFAIAHALLAEVSPQRAERMRESFHFFRCAFIEKDLFENPDFQAAMHAFQKDLKDCDA